MSSRRRQKVAGRGQRTELRRKDGPAVRGSLDVLSVGHGHMRLEITPGDKAELEKAAKAIEDMLARGFSIFVETKDGGTRRVKRFIKSRMVYLIDPPEDLPAGPAETPAPREPLRRRGRYVEAPVASSRATSVGRTAGG